MNDQAIYELTDKMLDVVAGASGEGTPKFRENQLVQYSNTCISCGTWRPKGKIRFTLNENGQYAYGVTFTCCNYLCGCTEEKLTGC